MHRATRLSVVLVSSVAAGAAYALAASPAKVDETGGARTQQRSLLRETPYRGVVARLPHIGTLTWRCDDEQRFFTKLTLETPGAGVTASLTSDGETVFRGRLVQPLAPPRHGGAGPFEARRTQTWTIRYHHKPATLKVVARVRFAAPRPGVECLVKRSVVDTRRTPH
jgi:hypothetical protein